jgi:hypothetical protein
MYLISKRCRVYFSRNFSVYPLRKPVRKTGLSVSEKTSFAATAKPGESVADASGAAVAQCGPVAAGKGDVWVETCEHLKFKIIHFL